MAWYTKRTEWSRWAGYKADLLRIAAEAIEEIAVWEQQRPRINELDNSQAVACTIDTQLRSGLNIRTNSLDEFLHLPDDDWLSVRNLTMRIEAAFSPFPRPGLSVYIGHDSALHLVVDGGDRTRVEGLHHRASEIIKQNASGPRWLALLATLPWAAIALFAASLKSVRDSLILLPVVVPAAIFLSLVSILAAYNFLFPPLELRRQGQQTRLKRSGSVAWGMALATGAAVIGIPIAKYLGWT